MHGLYPFTITNIKVSSSTIATTIMNSSMKCLLDTGNILDYFIVLPKCFKLTNLIKFSGHLT